MGRHLGQIDQPLVMFAGCIHLCLPASQLSDLSRLASLGGKVGQPLEGRVIGRLELQARLEGRSLGFRVAIPRHQPGPDRQHLCPGNTRSGHVGRGAQSSSGRPTAWAHSSRALMKMEPLGRVRSQRSSHAPASSNRPVRIARSAEPSKTNSSSGADCLALASAPVMASTGYGSRSILHNMRRVLDGSAFCSAFARNMSLCSSRRPVIPQSHSSRCDASSATSPPARLARRRQASPRR